MGMTFRENKYFCNEQLLFCICICPGLYSASEHGGGVPVVSMGMFSKDFTFNRLCLLRQSDKYYNFHNIYYGFASKKK